MLVERERERGREREREREILYTVHVILVCLHNTCMCVLGGQWDGDLRSDLINDAFKTTLPLHGRRNEEMGRGWGSEKSGCGLHTYMYISSKKPEFYMLYFVYP